MSKISLILLILFPLFSFAQQDAGKVLVTIKRPSDISIASDTADNIAYIFRSKKQYQFTLMDKNLQTQKNYVINRPIFERDEIILSTILEDQTAVVHLYNTKTQQLSRLQLAFSTGSHTFKPTGVIDRNEQYLSAFDMDGKFYLLTLPSQENELRVYSSEYGEPFVIDDYKIDYANFYKTLITPSSHQNQHSELALEKITYDLENNIKSAKSAKKIYAKDGKILIALDKPDATHLITINPETRTSLYKKLNFSIEKGHGAPSKQGNSFIHNNTLFRLTVSPEQLNVSVINLDSMELLNNYNVFPDKEIGINNGPVLVESGGGSYTGDEKVITRTSKLFKNLISGEVAIAVNQIDSTLYEVQVGAYQEYIARGGNPYFGGSSGMGMSFGFGGVYGPMFVTGGPGFYGPMGGGFGWPGYYPSYGASQRRIRVVYFRSLMGDRFYDHQQGLVPKTLREKIRDFEMAAFRNTSPEHLHIFPHTDKVLLGYYIKGKSIYKLVEFRK